MNQGHFLYCHKDLTGVADVCKTGKTITPYSAVRARQKYCWNQVGLDYLWFGFPNHIDWLECHVKSHFAYCSGNRVNQIGNQTELFQVPIKDMREFINQTISKHNLCVREIILTAPYVATSSGQCPFEIPGEKYCHGWLENKCRELFADQWNRRDEVMSDSVKMYNSFFDIC